MRQESNGSVRLTWEVALWCLVGVAALLLRVAQLDGAPLAAYEAATATAAWRAATGQGLPVVDHNPFLLVGNSLLFTLFGASDALARLWPAVFGSLLALTPALLRRSLGRVGALAAGAYLALSPTALVACRQLDGTAIGAVGAMVCAGAIIRFLQTERPRWLTLAAVGLGLGVSSGASVYGLLVPLGFASVLLAQIWPGDETSALVRDLTRIRSRVLPCAPAFGAALLVFATGLGWYLPGIGGVGELLAAWIGRFGPDASRAASPLVLLVTYEPLALVFALGAFAWGLLRERRVTTLLGLWGALAIILLALMPGRMPVDLLWVVVPVGLLAGVGVDELVRDRWAVDSSLRLVYGGIVLILWVNCYLMLARYAQRGGRSDLALVLIPVVLQGLSALTFSLVLGAKRTLRTAALGTGVVLLGATLAAAWGIAYRRPADPREALLQEPTAANVRDLVTTLEELSWRETGMPRSLRFPYEAPEDSVVTWYLRGFEQARRVDALEDLLPADVGSTAVRMGKDSAFPGGGEETYMGQRFAVRRHWTPRSLEWRIWRPEGQAAVEWLLFRSGGPLPEADGYVTLWRTGDLSYSH